MDWMNASLFVPGFPAEISLSPQLLVVSIISPHLFSSPCLLLGPKFGVVVVSLSVVMLGAAYSNLLLCIGHITGLGNQCYSSKISRNLERKWPRDFVVAQSMTIGVVPYCSHFGRPGVVLFDLLQQK